MHLRLALRGTFGEVTGATAWAPAMYDMILTISRAWTQV